MLGFFGLTGGVGETGTGVCTTWLPGLVRPCCGVNGTDDGVVMKLIFGTEIATCAMEKLFLGLVTK